MEFFDAHSHIHDAAFDNERLGIINEMEHLKIGTILVGTDRRSSQLAAQLACFYPHLFSAIGIHPKDDPAAIFNEAYFEELVASSKVVAIGECGLDYFRMEGDGGAEKKRQKDLFERQLEFAVRHKKALMIHCRDAHDELIPILESRKKVYGDALFGNIHFFTGGVSEAKKYYELGFSTSFPGVITFTHDYDEVVKYAPKEYILSETDSPYAAPVPYRGKRNSPVYVPKIVEKIAELRGEDVNEIKAQIIKNSERVFGISLSGD